MRKKQPLRKSKTSKNVVKLIRKSNELVEARYKFDIWETRIFTKMLSMVRKDDKDFQPYRIYLQDIVRDFQVDNNKDAYERLRKGGHKLMSKLIKVIRETDEGLMELTTPIVVGIDRLLNPDGEDGKFIDVTFHPDMKPFLLSLKSQFTTYDVKNILKLPSAYSIRLYELLKQYEKIGKREFDLMELKEIIGAIEEIDNNGKKVTKDNYPMFGNFKQRVLTKAQKDLKAYTDIAFEFQPLKRGRRVVGLLFKIYKNKPDKEVRKIIVKKKRHPRQDFIDEIHKIVKTWISKKTVENWAGKYPENQIRQGVAYTMKQIKAGVAIENIAGYLQSMVRQTVLFDVHQEKANKRKQQKEKEKQKVVTKATLEKELRTVYEEQEEKEAAIVLSLCNKHPEAKAMAMDQVSMNPIARDQYDLNLSDEQNLQNRVVRISFINAIRKQYPDAFEKLDQYYNVKIKKLRRRIASL